MSGAEPDSPCTAVCLLDSDTGLCRGCFRSLAEIAAWSSLDRAEKQRILGELPARRADAAPRPAAG
ncbi:MAG TPA: DUF1289 domain-containing protein [Stellaceae bacterium]